MLVVFAFAVKVIPSLLLSRFYGRRNALAAGFLLSSRLSLIIAASAIGLRLGVITPEINTAIILVAIITCVFSPAIYTRLRGKASEDEESHAVDLDALIGHVVKKKAKKGLSLQLVEIAATRFPFLCGVSLRDAKLRARTGLTLIALARADGTVIDNPGAECVVGNGDSLFLIGTEEQVQGLENIGATGELPSLPPVET